jgi:hypothetical protein
VDKPDSVEHGAETGARPQGGPPTTTYRVHIDNHEVDVHEQHPTGEELLALVGKKPCAFELLAVYTHHENDVVEPQETVDLADHNLKRFISAHKEIVTIYIDGGPYNIERGKRTVAAILDKVGKTADAYALLEEKDGPPLPLPANQPVHIHGCEVFHVQVLSGGSS